mmetsp:Transcript_4510/g.6788  ORF Transcript_4510/g.6788 Transcript_4510/m.6788 type:complete len:136 (-) Transcript_4510:473-880(-)
MQAARLKELLDTANFYEYSQLLKTIFFKFKMRRRFKEMKEFILQCSIDLGENKQDNLACDVFEIYYKEHVEKLADEEGIQDEFLFTMCEKLFKYGDTKRSIPILEKVVNACHKSEFVPFNKKICEIIGGHYASVD